MGRDSQQGHLTREAGCIHACTLGILTFLSPYESGIGLFEQSLFLSRQRVAGLLYSKLTMCIRNFHLASYVNVCLIHVLQCLDSTKSLFVRKIIRPKGFYHIKRLVVLKLIIMH